MSGMRTGAGRGSPWLRAPMALSVATIVSACGGAEAAGSSDAEIAKVEAARPNYSIRLDSESSDPLEFRVAEDDDGIRVQTGPAGIAYRPDDAISSGDFTVQATFQLFDAPVGYREAYGLFVGGLDLDRVDQEYTYLLVRPTGEFLVKRRLGEITETIVDWTAHDAVLAVVEDGDEPVNALGVRVAGADTRFLVNGVVVHTAPTSRVRPYGVAGVRVNHRLDVRVDQWTLLDATDSD